MWRNQCPCRSEVMVHRCFPTEAAFSEKNDVGSSTYGKQVVNSNVPVEGMPKVVLSDDVDHEFGIATGLELKELVAEKQGIKLFDYLDPPSGPFGLKIEDTSLVKT
ncbi:hypothetical protein KP509_09G091600 [Ceratopteris richardii]|uniref:Uncharacterized protein n=1 Tax=Ceratopteris richardii TaxID=49495 RepID=A0A8T2UAB3_CERRI|nr:hypothetical protein KP509_09G091600 [Ceratopteris richardii]